MNDTCKICGKLEPCEHERDLVTDFHHVIPHPTPASSPRALPQEVPEDDQEEVEAPTPQERPKQPA